MDGGVNISRLQNLSKDKYIIINKIIESPQIVKALYYTDANFLDKPDLEKPEKLIYNNIFPFRRIPDDNDLKTRKTYLTLSFRDYRPVKTAFKSGLIYISVFTHQDLFRTDYGFLRTDFIINKIDEILNNNRAVGIGKTSFYYMDEYYINSTYSGLTIGYKLYEWN